MLEIWRKNTDIIRLNSEIGLQTKFGAGLEFDGVNDEVIAPTVNTATGVNASQQAAIELVANSNDLINRVVLASCLQQPVPLSNGYRVFLSQATIVFQYTDSGGNGANGRVFNLVDPLPSHFVCRKVGSDLAADNFEVFQNGKILSAISSIENRPLNYVQPNVASDYYIGSNSATNYANATVYRLRHFNNVLVSNAQILELYETSLVPSALLPSLELDYDFNYNSGDVVTIADRSGNGRHGTINGVPLGLNQFKNYLGNPFN